VLLQLNRSLDKNDASLTLTTLASAAAALGKKINMKPSTALQANRAAIRAVVERHHACNARVFGSVLHGDDHEASDLDILIDPTSETTLFDVGAIRHELMQLLGVDVDVLTPNALRHSKSCLIVRKVTSSNFWSTTRNITQLDFVVINR
jgi:predicted nucleotidyltransferase